nr:hypothetical protein [Tanacetum cinerariifolium]
MASKNTSLEVAFSGDARYLTKLLVFGKGDELSHSATTEELFLPLRIEDSIYMLKQKVIKIASGFGLDDNSPLQVIGPLTKEPYIMQPSYVNVSDECSSTNVNATFTDAGETNSYMKQGRKRKRGSDDTMVLVIVTYRQDIKSFRFPISLEQLKLKRLEREVLLKLKNEVAKRFKLMRKVNCLKLKYRDEDDDLILIGVDKDLELAMVASGSENCMNLICMPSAD